MTIALLFFYSMSNFTESTRVNVDSYKPFKVIKWTDYFKLELAVIMGFASMALLGSPGSGKTIALHRLAWLLLGNYKKGIFISNSARYTRVWKDRSSLPSEQQQRRYLPPNFEVYTLRKNSAFLSHTEELDNGESEESSRKYLLDVGKEDTNLSDVLRGILKREESNYTGSNQPILLILDDLSESLKEKPILIGLKALLMRGFNLRVHTLITAQRPQDIPEILRPLFRYVIWMNTGAVRNMSLRIINTYLQETFPNNAKVVEISQKLGPEKTAVVIKATYSPARDLEQLDKSCALPNNVKRVEIYRDNVHTQKWMSSTRADIVSYWDNASFIKTRSFTSLGERLDQPSLYGQLGENIFYPKEENELPPMPSRFVIVNDSDEETSDEDAPYTRPEPFYSRVKTKRY